MSSQKQREITILVAASENGVIGRQGQMPWRLSSDLKRFRRLTMGHAIIMGRKTFESIGRPLPGRQTIVLTRNLDWKHDGVQVAQTPMEALSLVPSSSAVFVVGGGEVYSQFLPWTSRIELTLVKATLDGDAYFFIPPIGWQMVASEPMLKTDKDDFECDFQTWIRRD